MKNKINKIILLLKKDGLFVTLKKIYKYIHSKYLIKFNLFNYLYIKLNRKKILEELQEILNNNYDILSTRNIIVFVAYTIIILILSIIVFKRKMIGDNK